MAATVLKMSVHIGLQKREIRNLTSRSSNDRYSPVIVPDSSEARYRINLADSSGELRLPSSSTGYYGYLFLQPHENLQIAVDNRINRCPGKGKVEWE